MSARKPGHNGRKGREKQELASALRDSEERYRLVTEHTHDAIFLVDLEGRYTFGNRRLEEVTGYRLEELIGQSVFMGRGQLDGYQGERHADRPYGRRP